MRLAPPAVVLATVLVAAQAQPQSVARINVTPVAPSVLATQTLPLSLERSARLALGANLLHRLAAANSHWNPGLPRSESHMGSTRRRRAEMSDGIVRRYACRFAAASDSPTSVST